LSGGENGKDPSGVDTPYGYMPSWGNYGNDSGGECGVPPANRFRMPASQGSNGIFWYSYDYGSVHTIVLSSEHDLSPGSPQNDWLVWDLAAVDRVLTPWLVVESHRPFYHAAMDVGNNNVASHLRSELEDLFLQNQVDLVVSGHYHSYQRTCDGLYQSRCDRGGPTYLTIGTAGTSLDRVTNYYTTWLEKYVRGQYGYGRFTVHNASALHFEFVQAGPQGDPSTGQILDDVWITRNRP